MKCNLIFLFTIFLFQSCISENKIGDIEKWKESYTIVVHENKEEYQECLSAIKNFDFKKNKCDDSVISSTIQCFLELEKKAELKTFLNQLQSYGYSFCALRNKEEIQSLVSLDCDEKEYLTDSLFLNKINIMYLNDQYARGQDSLSLKKRTGIGNVDAHLYGFVKKQEGFVGFRVDSVHISKLKKYFETNTFPTKEQIGRKGLSNFMVLLQHSDQDKEFQHSILEMVKQSSEMGGVSLRKYAYFIDRVLCGMKKPQRFGTQFSNVSVELQTATSKPIEEEFNVDQRRMKVGLMPLDTYKELMVWRMTKDKYDRYLKRYNNSDYYTQKRIKMDAVAEGYKVPSDIVYDREQNALSTDSLLSQNTLYMFWATWCGPCLKKIEIIEDNLNKCSDDNYKIVTISVDDSIDHWLEYVENKDLKGDHYWIGNKEESSFFSLAYSEAKIENNYVVLLSLPQFVLVDKKGTIGDKSLKFESLDVFEAYLLKYCGGENN